MRHYLYTALVFGSFLSINSYGDEENQNFLLKKKYGDEELSTVVVDTAPGVVSAMFVLGVTSDQTLVIENPKSLSLAIKGFDKKSTLGISITPARTSFVPLNISTYNDSSLARIWGSTTFSYAQGASEVNDQTYDRRAISVDSSIFLEPEKDDPLIMYWNAIGDAPAGGSNNPCLLIPDATKPDPNSPSDSAPVEDAEANKTISTRAKECRKSVSEKARWNASKAWFSLATGHYQHETGGDSESLGKTTVIGGTWGYGDKGSTTAAALTAAVKRIIDAPTIESFGNANPTLQSSTLATMRLALGSETIRLILEGSDVEDKAPTAPSKAFKSALGLDAKISDDIWLNLRVGKQRRIDNSGDEDGSSITLSYSPSALLKL